MIGSKTSYHVYLVRGSHMDDQTGTLESTFSGLFLDALQQAKTPEQTQHEANYVELLMDLTPPARLLDVPCGGGRIALELAARGYTITGVDIAQPALDQAQRAAEERQLSTRLTTEQRDMRDLPWTAEFDAAYCLWESFGYFDDEGNAAFLRAVARALKPGGQFMLDTHITETMLRRLRSREWEQLGDNTLALEEREYDHVTGIASRHFILVQNGQIERRTLAIRLYTYRELVNLLESAGFGACQGYAWLSMIPFMVSAPRLIMTARKL